jgi:hypothetical protein
MKRIDISYPQDVVDMDLKQTSGYPVKMLDTLALEEYKIRQCSSEDERV